MPITARSYLGLLVLGLGTLVGPLDSSVNIAFPYITGAFGVPLEDIRWVIVSYVLTYSSLMLVFGKLGDLFGHRLILTAGLLVSAITFVLCATATEFGWLLAFRVAQGIGASLVLSCGPAIATSLFSRAIPKPCPRYLSDDVRHRWGSGTIDRRHDGRGLGLAGSLWFRVPISVLALLFVFILPKPSPATRRRTLRYVRRGPPRHCRFGTPADRDPTTARRRDTAPFRNLGCADRERGMALYAAVAKSKFARDPHAIFRDVPFAVFNLAGIAVNLTGFAILLLVPYYLSEVSGFSVGLGGFVLALSAIATMLASPAGGWLIGRFAANRMAFAGIALVGLSSIFVGLWDDTPRIWAMSAPLILSGLGIGLFQVSYMSTVTGTLPVSERGVAGSLALLTRTIGVVCSASFLTWAFSAFSTHHAASGMIRMPAF